ncbi:RPL3 [Scenedesmus sp. PABB004]|nr:RPL3 [Scenedesmus sp. PABB004]
MAWRVALEDVQHWADAPVAELLDAQSMPVRLPLTMGGVAVPLFGALAVEKADYVVDDAGGDAGDDAGGAGGGGEAARTDFVYDSVLFAGGPVWALAWAPLQGADARAGALHTVEVLALSAHPARQRRNAVGAAQHGPGALQLWAVPSSVRCALVPGGLPRLLALLWHEGRLAWDVQWCPHPAAFITPASAAAGRASARGCGAGGAPLAGVVAAVLGSGDVAVWAVPTAACLLELGRAAAGEQQAHAPRGAAAAAAAAPAADAGAADGAVMLASGGEPLSLRLAPIMLLPAAAVGGSLASCCAWLPMPPHDQLLVGCWNGNVAIWKLPTAPGGVPEPIQLLAADPTPITSVAWQPARRWWSTGHCSVQEAAAAALALGGAAAAPPGVGAACASYFLTASHVGNLKVWDVRDVAQPCHERVVSRNAITSALWLGPPHTFVTASADGVLRQAWLDGGIQAAAPAQHTYDGDRRAARRRPGRAAQSARPPAALARRRRRPRRAAPCAVSASCGCLWRLSACEALALVAYVGDGGLLGVMPLEPPSGESGRHRKAHAAPSGFAVDKASPTELFVVAAQQIPGNGALYTNARSGPKGRREGPTFVQEALPHPWVVLHALAFSPNYRGVALLAYGGGAGVVRLHTMSAEVVPLGAAASSGAGNAALRGSSGVRPGRAGARTLVVQARQAEAGVGIFGTKAGMMTYFTEEGTAVPATVIALEEGNMVTAVKSADTDGYAAVQVGYKVVAERKVRKPELGHLQKAGCPPMKHLREFKLLDAAKVDAYKPGDKLDIGAMFKAGDSVDVAGTSVGKGFQGTIKKYGMKRGAMTHGSKSHREHGSTGPGTTPGRTFPGTRMAGHMGAARRKVRSLQVLKVDTERGAIVLRGSVPGKAGNILEIAPAKVVGVNC